jgi:hypothetical protein
VACESDPRVCRRPRSSAAGAPVSVTEHPNPCAVATGEDVPLQIRSFGLAIRAILMGKWSRCTGQATHSLPDQSPELALAPGRQRSHAQPDKAPRRLIAGIGARGQRRVTSPRLSAFAVSIQCH